MQDFEHRFISLAQAQYKAANDQIVASGRLELVKSEAVKFFKSDFETRRQRDSDTPRSRIMTAAGSALSRLGPFEVVSNAFTITCYIKLETDERYLVGQLIIIDIGNSFKVVTIYENGLRQQIDIQRPSLRSLWPSRILGRKADRFESCLPYIETFVRTISKQAALLRLIS